MSTESGRSSWLSAWRIYTRAQTLRMFFLGFASGLPLLLVLGTLSFWLREAGIELSTIGMVTWVGLAYGFKWAWAPLVDRLKLPILTAYFGRRRAWLLFSQLSVTICLVAMSLTDPQQNLMLMIVFTTLTAFFSATQDIALDAYRIESAQLSEQAALAATYQTGYRLAMIWAGAGALALAAFFASTDSQYDPLAWQWAYMVMASSMVVGLVTVLLSPEPTREVSRHTTDLTATRLQHCRQVHPDWSERKTRLVVWFYEAACLPFIDFFTRYHWHAAVILALVATYRISDVVMGVMANPFYQDLGFSKEEVAAVSKVFGVVMTLLGAFIGGMISTRLGVMKTLFLGGLLSAITNLLFSWLATQGHHLPYLMITVSADNLAAGIASVAFLAYLAGLTNTAYTATQYALFSSVMLLLPKFLAGFSGFVVESIGYSLFFVSTALIGVPVLVLVAWAAYLEHRRNINGVDDSSD
ncbi:MAG TPA: MFS transporter [Candidatus Aphodousia faecavium]|nr:MFS transporter [Candidatus Aphodousia faecavium]